MRHSQIQKQLSAYLDGELSPQAREKIGSHLRSCDKCADIFADIQQNRRLFSDLRQPVSADIWQSLRVRIEADEHVQKRKRFRWASRPVFVGVGGLVAACLVMVFFYFQLTPASYDDTLNFYLTAYTEYTTEDFWGSDETFNSLATEEDEYTESNDVSFSGETQVLLNAYLDVYSGD